MYKTKKATKHARGEVLIAPTSKNCYHLITKEYMEEYNLCRRCKQADKTCPVYDPNIPTFKCVEWKPIDGILEEVLLDMVKQNAN
jgi:hypothetical protein